MEPSTDQEAGGRWTRAPGALRDLMGAHAGPVILDFDETLYLRNSTEDFLDAAWPAIPAKLLLKMLDIGKPWRFSGGLPTRDVWRLALVLLLFPWTLLLWRRRVSGLGVHHTNTELAALAAGRPDVIVASIGFGFIIRPLLARVAPGLPLVACRFGLADRRAGKLALLHRRVGAEAVARALVVTDSLDDAALLDACVEGCLVRWPRARFRPAMAAVYLPFDYLNRVKRPNSRYVWQSILQEDFAFWVLASMALAASPVRLVLGLGILLVSFWAVYEIGYVENDRIAERFERDPKLSAAYGDHGVPTPPATPWIWAALCGAAGIAILAWPASPHGSALLAWAAVLVATRACFAAFNRLDKASRVWLFPLLQLARAAAVAAVAPIGLVGAAGLGAHAVALWVPYLLYRHRSGAAWPDVPTFAVRLMIYLMVAALLFAADPVRFDWRTGLAFTAWNLYRARKDLRAVFRAAHRIDAPDPRAAPLPAVRNPHIAQQG